MVFDLKNLTYKIDRIPFNTFEVSKKKKLNITFFNRFKPQSIRTMLNFLGQNYVYLLSFPEL